MTVCKTSLIFGMVLVGWLQGCQPQVTPSEFLPTEKVIASAHGQNLSEQELLDMLPENLSAEDSVVYAKRLVDRWLQDQVMLNHATRELSGEMANLEQALEAYRRSLLINTFETRFVENLLDSEVSEEAIIAYYEDHPELFTLHDHAVQVLYFHLPDPEILASQRGTVWTEANQTEWIQEQKQLNDWLKQADSLSVPKLERWCIERGAFHHLDHEAWWMVDDLVNEVPLSLYRVEQQIQSDKPLSFTEEDRIYFVRFLNHGLKGKIAPLDLARVQITELILQKRRSVVLSELREQLLQEALTNGDARLENL